MARQALLDGRAAAVTTDLVEPARIATFEKLDEPRRAFSAAVGWLRSRSEVTQAPPSALVRSADSGTRRAPRQ
jgi:hypothetical protein